jgi:hypothetical protein
MVRESKTANYKVRTTIKKLIKKPISKVIVGGKADRNVFVRATEVMQNDDTSYRVRFIVKTGPHINHYSPQQPHPDNEIPIQDHSKEDTSKSTSFPTKPSLSFLSRKGKGHRLRASYDGYIDQLNFSETEDDDGDDDNDSITSTLSLDEESDSLLEIEGQGILIRDRVSLHPSHVSIKLSHNFFFGGFTNYLIQIDNVDTTSLYSSQAIEN